MPEISTPDVRARTPDKHAVAVAGVRHVGPAQSGDFRPPQPAHEQQAGDHGVESAPFSSDHLYRLSRAAVGVERMDRATHEEEARSLAASGVEAVKERYWEACSVVVELWRSGIYEGRIARRAGLGHGDINGMLRDAGENPK